ncbi:hypothetical protein F-LCD7_0298 [Faustovirus]|nr:hypothetical protein F-LCD7_0298 [Faustovirus]
MSTDWETIRRFSQIFRDIDTERFNKVVNEMQYSIRTTNNCVYGRVTLKSVEPIAETRADRPLPTYTYIFNTTEAYNAMHDSMRTVQSQISRRMTAAIRRPKVFSIDPDTIIKACIDINGNQIDGVNDSYIAAMWRYHRITDKSYLPLIAYKHFVPITYPGNVRIVVESTKLIPDATLEVEYSFVMPDYLSDGQLEKRREIMKTAHDEWINKENNHLNAHDINECSQCIQAHGASGQFDLSSIIFDDYITSYYPSVKCQYFEQNEFSVRSTPVITLLTDETTNGVIRIKPKVLLGTDAEIEMVYASVRPGVYELQPYDNDHYDYAARRLNTHYLLGWCDYVCDKPLVCYIKTNLINTSAWSSVMRYWY